MADRVRPLRAERVKVPLLDWSGGIRGNVSDLAMRARHVKRANNLVMEPERAMSVRGGTRRLIDGSGLSDPPHSLMKFYASGGNKLFVAAGTKIYLVDPVGGYVNQALPYTPSTRWMWGANLNGSLIVTQEGGTEKPIVFDGTAWLSSVLPTPTTVTLGQSVDGTSLVDAGTHLYRLRNRYRNGAGPAGASASISVTGGNRVDITGIPGNVAGRSDYLGWTLERTKLGSSTLWYTLADGTGTTYTDRASDAVLQTLVAAADGFHAAPPHLEGLVAFGNRIVGWAGTNLYISQTVADDEASGVLNFRPTAVVPVMPDDGDDIVTCDVAGETLVVVKGMSIHTLDGFDIDSYVLRTRYQGAGAIGSRAAKAIGDWFVFYSGKGRLNIANLSSWKVVPFGVSEVGHYLAEIDPGYDDETYLENDGGRYLEIHYRAIGDAGPVQCLRWNVQRRTWDHQIGPAVAHALIPKRADDFAGARYYFADPATSPAATPIDYSVNPTFQCWRDQRGANTQVYGQKVSSAGVPAWAANGVQASNSTGSSQNLDSALCGDGVGGIYVVFEDNRSGTKRDTYIQRFNSAGTPQFAAGGILLQAGLGGGSPPGNGPVAICTDGVGGAIAAWCYGVNGDVADAVYAQRISPAGALLWNSGAAVKVFDRAISGLGAMTNVVLIPRTQGGCWVVANNANATQGMRYQRLDANGNALGTAMGDYIAGALNVSRFTPIRDENDGVLIPYSTSSPGSFFVRKITADGAVAWTVNVASGRQSATNVVLVPDGSGGCFAAWKDYDLTSLHHIRFQRISAAGAPQFLLGHGIRVSEDSSTSIDFGWGVADGVGGAILSWSVSGAPGYVQRVDQSGALLWNGGLPGGVLAMPTGYVSGMLCSDGAEGAVMFCSGSGDLYAQRILADGTLPWGPAPGVAVAAATGTQDLYQLIFTDVPQEEVPPQPTGGYHVWSGDDGTMDQREADGTGGVAIDFTLQTHDMDDGEPEVSKLMEMIHVQTLAGEAQLTVNALLDGQEAAGGVAVSTSASGAKWAADDADEDATDTMYWDDDDWSGEGADSAPGPMPPGTRGKKYAIVASASTTAGYTLGGFVVDYRREPHREMSR